MKRVFAHIGFSAAITLIVLNFLPIEGAFVILVVTSVLFAVFMLIGKTRRAAALPVCMISCVLAAVIFIAFYYGSFLPQRSLAYKDAEIFFYISDIPEENDSGNQYTVKTVNVDIDNSPQNIKLSLYSDNRINADYNQLVKAKVKFKPSAENGYKSYGKYADNIFLSAYAYDFIVTDDKVDNPLAPVLSLKEKTINYFLDNLNGDDAGLAIAMVTGCRNYISAELYYMFKACGIMHIIAVSGLHLSVFAGMFYFVLKKLTIPKVPRVIMTMMFVIAYMAFVGFTPSILRAGLMFLVMCLARLSKYKDDTMNSLGFAVFVICLNPYSVTDVSAMLTVTSVLGIIVIFPKIRIKRNFKFNFLKYCADTFLLGISVIITTMPVMYLFFGYQSPVFVMMNIFVIPLVQFYLYILSASLAFSFSAVLSNIVFYPVKFLSFLLLKILEVFSNLSFLMLDMNNALMGIVIGFVIIFIGLAFIISRNKMKLTAVLSAVILVFGFSLNVFLSAGNTYVKVISGASSSALFVYNDKNAFAAGITDYSQFSYISNIVSTKNLEISMLIDSDNSKYAKLLADDFNVLNYAVSYDYKVENINCKNIVRLSDFNVDLWQGFNVKYNNENGKETIVLDLNSFSFVYTNDFTDVSVYDRAFYSDSVSDFDITYIINDNGFTERRDNGWLK